MIGKGEGEGEGVGDTGDEELHKLKEQHVGRGEWRPEEWDRSKDEIATETQARLKKAMDDLKSRISE